MSASFVDSFDLGGDSLATGETHSLGHNYLGPDPFSNFDSAAADSPPPIYVSGGKFTSDTANISSETNSNGPILLPSEEMEPEEGYALRDWRRFEGMAKIRERTEDFKDAARRAALNLGHNELESIGSLELFLMKHKKDYVDLHRTTEQERDSIEHEVTVFIKACKDQIDVLKNSINDEEAKSKGWLGIRSDNLNADTVAHKHGILILSEKLYWVTSQFDQLRALRFQDAINRVMPRRKLKRSITSDVAESSASGNTGIIEVNSSEIRQTDDVQAEPIRFQQQLLDDETPALQVELASMLDAVQETERKMVEMSALNHLMSTHVLQQAQQIEYLYEQAVEATKNVELGNKELSQAIQRNSSSRTFLLLFLFVLTFSIIFLDWYN